MRYAPYIILLAVASTILGIVCGLPEAARSRASLIMDRPSLNHHYDSPQGNFKIWYNLPAEDQINGIDSTDADDSGYPDWVEYAAQYLERTRSNLVDTLGARPPIPDFGRGGDDRTDVYFINLGSGLYGMTYIDSLLPDGTATSFMKLENDFSGFSAYVDREIEALAVTCAHEFFHTIHFAYTTVMSQVWWMEATAVWSEEQNFPEINDYISYLDYFQDYPSTALNDDTPSGRIYGTVLFPLYLGMNYSERSIIDIWERIPDGNAYLALDDWADSVGVRLDDLYGEFAHWNYFVGENYRGWGYTDAELMPEPSTVSILEFPETISGAGAAIYVDLTAQFSPAPDYAGGIWTELAGGDSVAAKMIGLPPCANSDTPDTNVNILHAPDTIPGMWRFDDIVATIGYLDRHYILSANLGDLLMGPATSATVDMFHSLEEPPYPNPFNYGDGDHIYFPYALTENSNIALYVWTSAGDLVYYMEDATSRGLHLTTTGALGWQPRNMRGERLATGIYVYRLAVENDEYIGKISIINP